MPYNKRFGLIVMVASIFLGIFATVFSISSCTPGYITGLEFVFMCLTFGNDPHEYDALFIHTKYLFLFFIFIFGLGFLWFQGAIKAPAITALKD